MKRRVLKFGGVFLGILLAIGGVWTSTRNEPAPVRSMRRGQTKSRPLLSVLSPPGTGVDISGGQETTSLLTGAGEFVFIDRECTLTCGQPGSTLATTDLSFPCIDQGRLLVEPAGTNVLLRSQELDNASWTNVTGTPTITANTWNFGLATTGETLVDDDAVNSETRGQSVTTATTGSWTGSCYFLGVAGSSTTVRLGITVTGGTGTATCNITGLSTTTTSRGSCTITAGAGVSSLSFRVLYGELGSDVGSVKVGGCQLETGAVATSYVGTSTVAATRLAQLTTVTKPATLSRTEFCTKVCVTPQWTGAAPPTTQWLLDGNAADTARFGYLTTTGYGSSDGTPVVVAVTWTGARRCFRTSGSASRNVLRVEDLTSGTSNTKAFTTMGAYDAALGIGYSLGSGTGQANALLDTMVWANNPDGCR